MASGARIHHDWTLMTLERGANPNGISSALCQALTEGITKTHEACTNQHRAYLDQPPSQHLLHDKNKTTYRRRIKDKTARTNEAAARAPRVFSFWVATSVQDVARQQGRRLGSLLASTLWKLAWNLKRPLSSSKNPFQVSG